MVSRLCIHCVYTSYGTPSVSNKCLEASFKEAILVLSSPTVMIHLSIEFEGVQQSMHYVTSITNNLPYILKFPIADSFGYPIGLVMRENNGKKRISSLKI